MGQAIDLAAKWGGAEGHRWDGSASRWPK
jgi:hypothetical protein